MQNDSSILDAVLIETPLVPKETSMEEPVSPLARLLHEEDGNVLLEYVTLLINVFLWVSLTVKPLQDAILLFAQQVFDHLHYT